MMSGEHGMRVSTMEVSDLGEPDEVVEGGAIGMTDNPAVLPGADNIGVVRAPSTVHPLIRMGELSIEELPVLLTIGDGFVKEFHGWRTGFKGELFLEKWRGLYQQQRGIVFGWFEDDVLVGVIGGVFFRDFYDDEPCVADMGWFTTQEHRQGMGALRLLFLLEKWAKERGAKRLTFAKILTPGDYSPLPDYERLGFYPREVSYGKLL